MEFFAFSLVGVCAGLVAGLLGLGGGIVTIPFFLSLFPLFGIPSEDVMHVSIATALCIIIPTSISSAFAHHKKNAINWKWFIRLAPGLCLGSITGALFVNSATKELLLSIFAIFLIIVGINLLINRLPAIRTKSNTMIDIIAAFFVGASSSGLGVGGGTLTVPYLVRSGVNIKQAIGTSAICGLPIASSAIIVFYAINIATDNNSRAYIYWVAVLGVAWTSVIFAQQGAKLAHRLGANILRKIFASLLFIVALKLLYEILLN